MVKALYDLAPVFIKWPSDNNINEVWTGFEAISGFPKIIGAIDGTHINIQAPRVQPASYVNRKGHHSIQLQVRHILYLDIAQCVFNVSSITNVMWINVSSFWFSGSM